MGAIKGSKMTKISKFGEKKNGEKQKCCIFWPLWTFLT